MRNSRLVNIVPADVLAPIEAPSHQQAQCWLWNYAWHLRLDGLRLQISNTFELIRRHDSKWPARSHVLNDFFFQAPNDPGVHLWTCLNFVHSAVNWNNALSGLFLVLCSNERTGCRDHDYYLFVAIDEICRRINVVLNNSPGLCKHIPPHWQLVWVFVTEPESTGQEARPSRGFTFSVFLTKYLFHTLKDMIQHWNCKSS